MKRWLFVLALCLLFAAPSSPGAQQEAGRCNADTATVDLGRRGPIQITDTDCNGSNVRNTLRQICAEALREARSNCDRACGLMNRLDDSENPIEGSSCQRDKEKSTVRVAPNCNPVPGRSGVFAVSCTAEITCECQP